MQRAPVALEAVTERRKRAVLVHPLAQVAENLLASLAPVERFQLGPLLRLRLADEGEHRLGEDRTLAVEALARDRHVAVLEEVGFDDCLEGGFRVTTLDHAAILASL